MKLCTAWTTRTFILWCGGFMLVIPGFWEMEAEVLRAKARLRYVVALWDLPGLHRPCFKMKIPRNKEASGGGIPNSAYSHSSPMGFVVAWIRMALKGSYIQMLSHQGVALFQSIRRCGLVGGTVLLGLDFKVSKAQTWPSGSLPASYLQM